MAEDIGEELLVLVADSLPAQKMIVTFETAWEKRPCEWDTEDPPGGDFSEWWAKIAGLDPTEVEDTWPILHANGIVEIGEDGQVWVSPQAKGYVSIIAAKKLERR